MNNNIINHKVEFYQLAFLLFLFLGSKEKKAKGDEIFNELDSEI